MEDNTKAIEIIKTTTNELQKLLIAVEPATEIPDWWLTKLATASAYISVLLDASVEFCCEEPEQEQDPVMAPEVSIELSIDETIKEKTAPKKELPPSYRIKGLIKPDNRVGDRDSYGNNNAQETSRAGDTMPVTEVPVPHDTVAPTKK